MGFLSKLFDQNTDESVLEVEAKIAELDTEEKGLRRRVDEISVRRGAHLRTGDHAALKSDEQIKADTELALEGICLARVELAERLNTARDRARRKIIEDLSAEKVEIVDRLREAMLTAIAMNEQATAFHEKAISLLGQNGGILFPPFAFPLLRREMLDPWTAYLDQMNGPKPKSVLPVSPVKRVVEKVAKRIAPPRTRPQRDPLPSTIGNGMSRVVVLRGGYQAPDGKSYQHGEQLDLLADIAMAAVRSGALDFVPTPPPHADTEETTKEQK